MSKSESYVVVGLGASGLSCVRHLKQLGQSVMVSDTRLDPPNLDSLIKNYPDVPLSLGRLDATFLAQADTIVLSPGISLKQPEIATAQQRGQRIVGDIELFAQAARAPIIAITGTNAKSTVTTLVGKMAEAAGYQVGVGGNLGVPALDLLSPEKNLYVLELSSFQLETTDNLRPVVATVLNVTPDHMDRYETLTDYQMAKLRIYQDCGTAVWNKDDALTQCPVEIAKQFYFTEHAPQENTFGLRISQDHDYLSYEQDLLLPTEALPVVGKHYQINALAALALGYAFGLPFAPMLSVLKEFKGLPHRCQLVRELHGVKWYNDSKGTNVGASQAAIEGLGKTTAGKLVLIAGGLGKNADFNPLATPIAKYTRHVVLIGQAADDLAKVLGQTVPYSKASTMEEAIEQAAHYALAKDAVLLSPACASFDMFKSFEHRGQVFSELVEKLV